LENRNVAASISAENVRRSEMLDSSAIQVRDILRALTEVVQGVGTKTESSNAALSESKVRITNIKSSNLVEEASLLIDQIDNMINVNNTLKTELAEAQGAINEQKTVIDSLQTEVRIDSLTQLGNRMALEERIAESLGRFERYQEPFCILMIDIDHFKKINDTYGHPAGDRILKGLSAKMKATLRNSDFIGRYGGEEFCAIVVNGDLEKGKAAAENLRIAVESAKFNLGGKKLGITISIGVAGVQDADGVESLIKNADTALYRAKEFGRNMVCISE
jgi:diguanylate cyclase